MSEPSSVLTRAGILFAALGIWSSAAATLLGVLAFEPPGSSVLFRLGEIGVQSPFALYPMWRAAHQLFSLEATSSVLLLLTGYALTMAAMLPFGGSFDVEEGGDAQWGTLTEAKAANLLIQKGVTLGCLNNQMLRYDGERHIFLAGPTGTGKSVSIIIPSLLDYPGSVFINDNKNELWDATAGYRSSMSYTMLLDPARRGSVRYNPIAEIRGGDKEIPDAQNISLTLADPDGGAPKDYWGLATYALYTGGVLYVKHSGEYEPSLRGLYNFLSNPDESFEKTLDRLLSNRDWGARIVESLSNFSINGEPPSVDLVLRAARDMKDKAGQEMSGVLSNAKIFLDAYKDPLVAHNTADSDFRIRDLVHADKPCSLYVCINPENFARLRFLVRLLIRQTINRLCEELPTKAKPRHRLLMALDEFPALGKLPGFEQQADIIRGYWIQLLLACQAPQQVHERYGLNSSLLSNCLIQAYFRPGGQDQKLARELSERLGMRNQITMRKSYSGSRLFGRVNISEHHEQKPLLSAYELSQPREGELLLFGASRRPFRLKARGYWKDPKYKRRTSIPPPLLTALSTSYPAELLPPKGKAI